MLTETHAALVANAAAKALALLSAIVLPFALTGCGIGYLTQAAHGQWQVLLARRPIAAVIADPAADVALKARLALVQDARNFASHALALPDNRSYRSYSDVGRPYVVWNVVAAPEFSVQPLRWCFPITGCIAYRGYFREAAARAFAASLADAGRDVLVAGVTAYSTLGHFADPVLNTMMRYGDLELIGTIFHELAHQLIYVAGDSEFNESFAMTVEQEGLARWLAARGRSAELGGYLQRREQQQVIVGLFAAGRRQLDGIYREALPVDERRTQKLEVLSELGRAVKDYEQEHQLRSGYDEWIGAGLNNAHLASIGTYFDCIPSFRGLMDANHGNLPAFYATVRRLGRAKRQTRHAFCASAPAKQSPH